MAITRVHDNHTNAWPACDVYEMISRISDLACEPRDQKPQEQTGSEMARFARPQRLRNQPHDAGQQQLRRCGGRHRDFERGRQQTLLGGGAAIQKQLQRQGCAAHDLSGGVSEWSGRVVSGEDLSGWRREIWKCKSTPKESETNPLQKRILYIF